jgi:cytochrome c biogenesis protein CcmG/thiol:disulfide interchange protein DsbE
MFVSGARRQAFSGCPAVPQVRVRPLVILLATLFVAMAPTMSVAAAADWSLEDVSGRRVSFADELARGPVVVSFWATWCKPCLKEMPQLDALAATYAGRVTFLAVNTDDSKSVAKVEPLVRARGWENLTVLLDPGAVVQRQLQVDAMPYLVLYDRDGSVAFRHTGYVEGGEAELQLAIEKVLTVALPEIGAPADDVETDIAVDAMDGDKGLPGELLASDRFEYSYATDTRREIVENWLDLGWHRGNVRAGLTLNSQAPGEEGGRRNEITHRWFEFTRDGATVRAGHFHGLFGRGLLFNAWQDRSLRIDTRLDGVMATVRRGNLAATVLSGTPSVSELDVRAADLEWSAWRQVVCGVSGITWHNSAGTGTEAVDREWAAAVRARQSLAQADWYVEIAARNRFSIDAFDYDAAADDPREGWALYGNLNLYRGPFTLSWEGSDYQDFELLSRADGVTSLNRPPALAREFMWTLLNRAPHTLNANDEKGHNLDLSWQAPNGVAVQASASRLRLHDGGTVYESVYLGAEKEQWGDFGVVAGLGFQDSEGLRQTLAAEVSWRRGNQRAWSFHAEHQHVRVGGGVGFDLGAYDQQWCKLEYSMPRWIFAAMLETNNKYGAQRSTNEDPGPYAAIQATRNLPNGATLNLWAGERQEGFLCAGGVCKFEPAFSGLEFFGTLRW